MSPNYSAESSDDSVSCLMCQNTLTGTSTLFQKCFSHGVWLSAHGFENQLDEMC